MQTCSLLPARFFSLSQVPWFSFQSVASVPQCQPLQKVSSQTTKGGSYELEEEVKLHFIKKPGDFQKTKTCQKDLWLKLPAHLITNREKYWEKMTAHSYRQIKFSGRLLTKFNANHHVIYIYIHTYYLESWTISSFLQDKVQANDVGAISESTKTSFCSKRLFKSFNSISKVFCRRWCSHSFVTSSISLGFSPAKCKIPDKPLINSAQQKHGQAHHSSKLVQIITKMSGLPDAISTIW